MSENQVTIRRHGLTDVFDSLDIAESTRQDYLQRIPRFVAFAEQNGVNRDLLLKYKQSLRDDVSLGISAKNKNLISARIALRELYRRGNLAFDLSVGVKSFRQSTRHKVMGLDSEEVDKIFQHLKSLDDSFPNVRLRLIVALLLLQGMRQVEICRLDVSDVDLQNNRLYVLGKGENDKEPIHLHPETANALRAYLRGSQVKFGTLFTHLNRQSSGQRLTTRGLRRIVQNLFQELGIDRTVHGSRHWFTTTLIKHYKSDLTTVARFTRHKSLEMLMTYDDEIMTKTKAGELSEVFDYEM